MATSEGEVRLLVAELRQLAADPERLAALPEHVRVELLQACGALARPTRSERKAVSKAQARLRRQVQRRQDAAALATTGMQRMRAQPVFQELAPPPWAAPPAEGDRAQEDARAEWDSEVKGDASAVDETYDENAAYAGDVAATDHRDPGETPASLRQPRKCYVCKAPYQALHHFYATMCMRCADFNWAKRQQSADLTGRVALVTGGRVKIGFHIALKLLRAGAEVIVVTRFPVDATRRFLAMEDHATWSHRVSVYGLDLRHTPSVEVFCEHLRATRSRLDILINNACQTVRRPSGYYADLMPGEVAPWDELAPEQRRMLAGQVQLHAGSDARADAGAGSVSARRLTDGTTTGGASQAGATALPDGAASVVQTSATGEGLWRSAVLSQLPLLAEDLRRDRSLFPAGRVDADLQQVDLREFNSWRMRLHEVPTAELLEVQLVNAIAPFLLNARLKPLMMTPTRDAHIVNVSAMEGQFYRKWKTDKHPHTNMAKAALNMLTRTSAADYVQDGIHMNAVDTGWVTDEDPAALAARKADVHAFVPPLDIVDGAARVLDPVFTGYRDGKHVWGLFLKDYQVTPW